MSHFLSLCFNAYEFEVESIINSRESSLKFLNKKGLKRYIDLFLKKLICSFFF